MNKNLQGRRSAAWMALLLALAACGGGSGPPPSASATPARAAADARVTLAAYSRERVAGVPAAAAPDAAPDAVLSAALALALPPLQGWLHTTSGGIWYAEAAVVLPALQAARLDVLRAAAAGSTLAEVEAALPAAASDHATQVLLDGVARRLWAPASARFNRSFLKSTDRRGSAFEPWRAAVFVDWSDAAADLAEFGDADGLELSAQTRLLIGQSVSAHAPVAGQMTAFEGVGEHTRGGWYTAPMLALEGPGGTLRGVDHVATATWVGETLWVSLRPPGDEPLFDGLSPATLGAALLAAWSAFPAPEAVSSRSTQIWPQLTMMLDNRSRRPPGIELPYHEVQADLSGLDGGGTFLTETTRPASLAIDTQGLRIVGELAMAFTFSVANQHGGGSYGINSELLLVPSIVFPGPCPRATADWRGAYLALIDRAGRLLLVATLPDVGRGTTACRPI